MNKERRSAINEIITALENFNMDDFENTPNNRQILAGKLDDLKAGIDIIKDEEQDYFDNMPESLQGGEKGQMAEEAIDALDNAMGHLQDAVELLEEDVDDDGEEPDVSEVGDSLIPDAIGCLQSATN